MQNVAEIEPSVPVLASTQPDFHAFEELETAAQVRLVHPHEHLFLDGDSASHFYEVLDGFLCVYKLLPDGRRHIISFAFPGDLIALGAETRHRFSAEAIEKAQVRCIAKSNLSQTISRDPDLAQKVIGYATNELAEARDQLLTVSRRSAMERVGSFLMALSRRNAKRNEDPTTLSLPMTRLDIADYLGLTLETVSRTISKLKAMGIIDLPHSSVVVVTDMVELEAIAEV